MITWGANYISSRRLTTGTAQRCNQLTSPGTWRGGLQTQPALHRMGRRQSHSVINHGVRIDVGRQARAASRAGQTPGTTQHKAVVQQRRTLYRRETLQADPWASRGMALLACSLSLVASGGASAQLSSASPLRAIGRMRYLVRNIFHVLAMSSTVQARPEMSLLCNMLQKQVSSWTWMATVGPFDRCSFFFLSDFLLPFSQSLSLSLQL